MHWESLPVLEGERRRGHSPVCPTEKKHAHRPWTMSVHGGVPVAGESRNRDV